MADDIFKERDICFNSPDPEFLKISVHFCSCIPEGSTPCRHFDEQGIIVWSDNSPLEAVPCIQTDAEAPS